MCKQAVRHDLEKGEVLNALMRRAVIPRTVRQQTTGVRSSEAEDVGRSTTEHNPHG